MKRWGQRLDWKLYFEALPLYARNLGVLLGPLVAAAIGLGLEFAEGPLFNPIGGAGDPLINYVIYIIYGFGFSYAVIFADDAWRFGRGNLQRAWNETKRKAGSIFIAVLGFMFLIFIAELIGGFAGPYGREAVGALAVWAFIYAMPAAALGGVPGGAAFSASLQAARRHPLATAILTIVSLVVWFGLSGYALEAIGNYLGTGFDVAFVLLRAIAMGYIALILARQYTNLAFGRF